MPLNPVLYALLNQRFKDVRIANETEELVGKHSFDPTFGKQVLTIEAHGETYCVDCPYCGDTRQRLWVNHMYGVYDKITDHNNNHLVRCFNEDCIKSLHLFEELYEKIYGLLNQQQRKDIKVLRGNKPLYSASELKEAPSPGEVVYINTLCKSHPARQYLEVVRGYDIDELVERWQIMYCNNAIERYITANNRIIIPIIQNDIWVGWQARYAGDVNWKQLKIPKYYTLPGMPKRLTLYNHDVAIKQDFVVICEGPISTWAVYPYGVGTFGKNPAPQQIDLLRKEFVDRPIVILLDADAILDARKMASQLSKFAKFGISVITLPANKDPDDYRHNKQELWDIIYQQSKEQNIRLPRLKNGYESNSKVLAIT